MNDFRSGDEFAALMISLGRIEQVNHVAFEAASASERDTQGVQDRRRLERENKYLSRQLRSALICSAYSLAEAAIIGLAPSGSACKKDIQQAYGLRKDGKIPKLYRAQYLLQHVTGICVNDPWDRNWSSLHRLRKLRNTLIHDGGVGEVDALSGVVDRDDGFAAWVEPMFEGSEISIYVLVIGELHFRQWLQMLQKIVYDIDAELSKLVTE